jgi:hypothetical protein
MQNGIAFVVAMTLTGCATHQRPAESKRPAVVATATEEQCDRPGVRIDAVKQLATNRAVALADSFSSVEVEPGRYAISVACQNPLNEAKGQCVFLGHPNEYPTYKMPLKAGMQYTFKCYEVNGEILYRVSENNL